MRGSSSGDTGWLDEPDFPHHSTADQFFTETQFEAYRALGEHVGDKLFLAAIVGTQPAQSENILVDQWFAETGARMLEPLRQDKSNSNSIAANAGGLAAEPQILISRGSKCSLLAAVYDRSMIRPQTVAPAAYGRAPLAMPKTAPLRLLLFRNPEDQDTDPYENAIARAFQGGRDAGGYLVTGEDLGVQWQVFSSAPQQDAAATLDSFCHTMTIVLVDNHLLKSDDALWNWLAACWVRVRSSDGRHAMLVVAMDERTGRAFLSKRPENETLQLLYVHDLGERAIRPTMLALRLLHRCRILLASALPDDHEYRTGHLRLFISHAKLDGLPLAYALKR
jgi:hypothetical protein